jgi:hypothetical protein
MLILRLYSTKGLFQLRINETALFLRLQPVNTGIQNNYIKCKIFTYNRTSIII